MIAGYPYPLPRYQASETRGLSAQKLGLFLVWLTMASSSVVFAEPAPFDVLMIGLVVLLPLLGLTSFSNPILFFLFAWLVIGAGGMVSSTFSNILDVSTKHILISMNLALSGVMLAAFVRSNPKRHIDIALSGFVCASVIAAVAGIGGYFGFFPGMNDFFTEYGRARGMLKDPNVFGAFIVVALIYYLHAMVSRPAKKSIIIIPFAGLIVLGLLVSFSRGAWINAAIALIIYGYLQFIVAQTHRLRMRLVLIGAFGLCTAILGLIAILQIDTVADLLKQRASLTQSYDMGVEGRFGGQLSAIDIILENPLGIGALDFAQSRNSEDVHNVYLSMFLNTGWVGGFGYLGLVLTTLAVGLRNVLRPCAHQSALIIVLACFAGVAVEGAVIDTDHWRHYYILMGLVWGLALTKKDAPKPNYLERIPEKCVQFSDRNTR